MARTASTGAASAHVSPKTVRTSPGARATVVAAIGRATSPTSRVADTSDSTNRSVSWLTRPKAGSTTPLRTEPSTAVDQLATVKAIMYTPICSALSMRPMTR